MVLSLCCLARGILLVQIVLVVQLVSCSPVLLALIEMDSSGRALLEEQGLDPRDIGQLL